MTHELSERPSGPRPTITYIGPRLLLAGVIGLLTTSGYGCDSPPDASDAREEATAAAAHVQPASAKPAASSSEAPRRFGAAVGDEKSTPLAQVLAHPDEFTEVITEGKVERACSRKGCWMELAADDERCRVTFKDYGFFVPTDSAGAHAKVRAQVETRVISAANVKHLEAEGARFSHKQEDGTAREVQLVASAVELSQLGTKSN